MINIKISDITLRDCEQENTSKLSFKEKQEVAKLLEKLSVDIIETGYIKDTPGDVVFIRMLASALEQSVLCVPVKATKESIDEAWSALSKAKKPRLNLIIPTSTVGMEYSQHLKPDALLPLVTEMISYAKTLCPDIEFTADDAVRSETDYLASVINTAIDAGASTVTLCDCVGELLPAELSEFVTAVQKATPKLNNVTTAIHIKDNLSLASAAILGVLGTGVKLVKVSSNAESDTMGLESFLNVLKIRGETLGISCNLSINAYQRICSRLSEMTGIAKSLGQRATSRQSASGAAQSNAEGAALPEFSGIAELGSYIQSAGYDISNEDLERIFSQYKDIAKSKNVVADDIEALIAETAGQAPPIYVLKNYVINSGSNIAATAYIEFEKNGTVSTALSAGDGPIDAAFKAAESIFGTGYELEDFRVHAVTGGREATGDALIKLRVDGKLYSGRGVSTDIVGASIRAYLSAVNKILNELL